MGARDEMILEVGRPGVSPSSGRPPVVGGSRDGQRRAGRRTSPAPDVRGTRHIVIPADAPPAGGVLMDDQAR
jgi:hypothetical protein